MTQKGWMPIYRKLQDHWLWQDKPFAKGQAWLDLLLLASHNDNEFLFGNQVVKNEVGSFITSIEKLKLRWGWSNTKVVSFLNLLENEQMIIKKSDTKKTVITIVNYSVYADYETAKTMQKRNDNDTETIRKHTINNDNNDNNDNKYIYIKDIYNEICVSFPRLTVLSDKRKKAIKARLNTYTVDQIKEVFVRAEASDFLKGKNNRNWQANFDWLINDANMAKVLDGNYDNKGGNTSNQPTGEKPKSEYERFMEGLSNFVSEGE